MKDNCIFCGALCNEIYNFGHQPHATSLATDKGPIASFPLVLAFCPVCDLYQLNRSDFSFGEDYQFHSAMGKSYASLLYDFYLSYPISKDAIITEIGCNDGSLLSTLQKQGFKNLFGFEPVSHLANKAVEVSGAKVFAQPFNLSTFGRVPKSDLVILNHTFHQIDKLNETIEALRLLVKSDARVIIEVPDFEALVKSNAWDMISHDNRAYFTQSSMLNIMSKYFAIEKVTETEFPVFSKRYTFIPKGIPDYTFQREKTEIAISDFTRFISFSKLAYLESLIQWKKMHRLEIACFGASSKANSFLNFLGLDKTVISYCVDETPGKCRKLMPKSNIPIMSLSAYRELTKKPDIMLITAWNYAKEIKEKVEHAACWIKAPSGEFKRV